NRADMTVAGLKQELVEEGLRILNEDIELCKSIGRHGVQVLENKQSPCVLTHCNAGALATSDYGTALSPVYVAHEQGLNPSVFADETRPLLQGARLTTWELQRAGVPVTLICDNMAAQVMREGRVDCIIVGADRIAANGDAANKIGTYSLAINARFHNLPFYVAAPYSTIDFSLDSGDKIPIEQRSEKELQEFNGRDIAPPDCNVYNPAFDVTPAELITGIITERGLLEPPFEQNMAELNRRPKES
ncbi:MAG: S-methyl-5-thioribose-1-phosphate isomerase, partial [Planctomycetota bacterium]